MIEFTMVDYWRYQYLYPVKYTLNDTKEEYKVEKTHQYHDKVFKEILDNKKEFVNFIKRYTKYKTVNLKESNIERYNRKFITSNFLTKESDIIYKVKGRNVFIIVEHQSTIDYKMAERMHEYCMELIRSIRKESENLNKLYPLICPIVFYTGKKKWDAPRTITEVQEKYEGIKPLDYPKYNLIDINNYTKEELLKENTAIAKALLFEKLKTKEEMKVIIEKLIEKKLTGEEEKYLQIILNYSNDVRKKLEKEEIIKYKKILNKKGVVDMTNFEKLLIELIDEKCEKYRAEREAGKQEGQKIGQRIGQKNGTQKIINNMLKMKMSDQVILDVTQVNKKELERIKQELKAC